VNLADLKQEVLDHEFSVTRYSDYVVRQLNRAQLQIADRMDFRALFAYDGWNTVAGTAFHTLPTNFMRLDSLWSVTDQDYPLVYEPDSDFFQRPTASGKPTVYTTQGTSVYLYPTPDAAYAMQLQYHRSPVALVNDSDTPEIDSRCDQLLVSYTLARCYERENDPTQAQYHWGRYQEEFLYTMTSIQDDQDDIGQPRQIEGSWPDPGSSITVIRP
jgi:hypothetical protein